MNRTEDRPAVAAVFSSEVRSRQDNAALVRRGEGEGQAVIWRRVGAQAAAPQQGDAFAAQGDSFAAASDRSLTLEFLDGVRAATQSLLASPVDVDTATGAAVFGQKTTGMLSALVGHIVASKFVSHDVKVAVLEAVRGELPEEKAEQVLGPITRNRDLFDNSGLLLEKTRTLRLSSQGPAAEREFTKVQYKRLLGSSWMR